MKTLIIIDYLPNYLKKNILSGNFMRAKHRFFSEAFPCLFEGFEIVDINDKNDWNYANYLVSRNENKLRE